MIYNKSSIDIIREVVEAMTFPMVITNIATTLNNHILTVCDIKHAQPGFSIQIGATTYLILDIDAENKTITIQGTPTPVLTAFDLYKPFFFHGTPIATGIELIQEKQAFNKTPMVWFLENFVDHFYKGKQDMRNRDLRARLFFLTQADHEKWLTDDAYKNAIEPMHRLQELFLEELVKKPGIFDMVDFEYDRINYAKFGVYINNKGTEKNLFVDKLSGCEMPFAPLTILKHPCVQCETECP